ncbi:unnamed protein product [Oikopleura dioica]|uniref:EGF-like domain-containing protein n=1 Tax=Oikopleura dioica TaxID=34765 RepID=E4X1G4_OIKDI|nr:unnamed protein product [Oikopleura dioica]CBY30673.1 unnamed protein product [Oikopleura dioica]
MFNIFLIFIISVFAENIKIVQCPNGFFLNQEYGSCKDVDECASNSVCTSHLQNCKNTVGSFECECIDGYKAAPFGGCEEKTRCEQFGQECQWKCEENSKELIESKCVCPAGYYQSGSSVVTCHDINECLTRSSNYQSKNDCINLHGRYECFPEHDCPQGFSFSTRERACYRNFSESCNSTEICDFRRILYHSAELLNYPVPKDVLVTRLKSSQSFGRSARYSYEILEVTDKYGFLAHDSPAFFVKQRSAKSGRAEIHYLGKATFDGQGISRRIKIKYTAKHKNSGKIYRNELIEILVYVSQFDF